MSEITTAYGSNLQCVYAVEDAWGDLPSSYTVYNFRTTGFGINSNKDSFESNELRSDRQTADFRTGAENISGDIPVELSYGAFDDAIASAMFNSWASNDTITIGTTQKSLRIQRAFPAISVYHEFTGCVVNSWSISIQPNSIITSTFSFMGKSMVTSQTLSGAVDKATNSPFDSFSGYLREGGTTSSDEIAVITGIDLSLENNLTQMFVVGQDSAQGLAEGRASISGTVTAYFTDNTLLNKFLNETATELQIQLMDDSSNSYLLYMPNVRYSGASLSVDGEGPVTMSMPFVALYDATDSALKITKS